MVELDVTIEAGDLYDYMLQHNYNSPAGILGSCIGGLMVVVGAMNQQTIFIILGVILLVYLPWTLFIKSRQQKMNNPVFKETLHYVLNEEGITVSQGEASESAKWEDMYKAVSTTKSVIIYTTRVSATILPKRYMQDKLGDVIEVISTNMPPKKVKIRL